VRLSSIDIKQLRVFLAVVECGGFSAAEELLNISQSTISTHIAELERRLGYRLCERGRSGFALTDRGSEVYERSLRLLTALTDFEDGARALKGTLSGHLRLALIDNMITDPNCPIVRALASLQSTPHNTPRVTIEVLAPSAIEHAVASGRADLGITIVEKRLPTLRYKELYTERDVLVCSDAHPLFHARDEGDIRRRSKTAMKVVRSFLNHQDLFILSDREDSIRASVTNIEAAAFLILAGTHIGFLPQHFVRRWVDENRMRVLLPKEFFRESEIALVRRVDATSKSAILRHFLAALERESSQNTSISPM
jgi:DNA-binding transcriptional LysR family regulator